MKYLHDYLTELESLLDREDTTISIMDKDAISINIPWTKFNRVDIHSGEDRVGLSVNWSYICSYDGKWSPPLQRHQKFIMKICKRIVKRSIQILLKKEFWIEFNSEINTELSKLLEKSFDKVVKKGKVIIRTSGDIIGIINNENWWDIEFFSWYPVLTSPMGWNFLLNNAYPFIKKSMFFVDQIFPALCEYLKVTPKQFNAIVCANSYHTYLSKELKAIYKTLDNKVYFGWTNWLFTIYVKSKETEKTGKLEFRYPSSTWKIMSTAEWMAANKKIKKLS